MKKRLTMILLAVMTVCMGYAQNKTMVTPPSDATIENDWMCSFVMHTTSGDETVSELMSVAFSGNDVYFYLPNPITGNTWVKGTLDNGLVTFAKGQLIGNYSGSVYMVGQDEQGITDVIFGYDEQNHIFMLANQQIVLNSSATEIGANTAWAYYTDMTVVKGGSTPVTPEDDVVEMPSTISLSDYLFKASSILYDAEGEVAGMETVQYNVRVGFQGNDVYIQGLFESMPLACVKGTKNADGDYVFTSGQYYGHHPQIESQRFYFCGQIFGELSDVEMSYDKTSRVFSGGSYYILVNSAKNSLAPYYVFAGVTISKIADKAAVPATPSVVQYAAFNDDYGYGFVCFDVPATDKDGNAIAREKLNYKMYVQKEGVQDAYVFKPALYKNLSNDMSLVPYFFSDGYDFMLGGSQVCFYEESKEWEKIGVQSVYSGGYVNNNSDICWYDIKSGESGITQIVNSKSVNSKCYDLQGRKIVNSKSVNSKSARGVYIVNGKKVVR